MNVYCGPIVCCRAKMVKKEISVQVDCPNGHFRGQFPALVSGGRHVYCPLCGAKLSEKTETVEEEEVSGEFFEFTSEEEDSMISPGLFMGCRLFVPNDHRDPQRDFYLREGQGVFDMDDTERHAERSWLARAFVEEISELQAAYGAEQVSVVWGSITWSD